MQEQLYEWRKKQVLPQERVLLGRHEDGQTAGRRHQHGQHEEQGQIIGYLPVPRPGFLDLPDVVERILHGRDQVDHRIKQQDQTDPNDHSPLRLRQIALHELERLVQLHLMPGEIIEQFLPYRPLEAEALGYAQ